MPGRVPSRWIHWPAHTQSVAKDALRIAKGGLQRRGHDEAGFLARLDVIAETGLTQVCA
jgi:gamma-glutamylcysteine synthetase